MNVILPFITAFSLLLIFYHYTIRKVLVDMQRFKLFDLRDQVRMMGVNGIVSPQSFEFQYIERMLCELSRSCEHVTLSKLIEGIIRGRDTEQPIEAKRFKQNALNDLKEIESKAVRYFLLTIYVNSPTFSVLILISVITAEILGWIRSGENWLQAKVRSFAEETIFRDGLAA